ncbi:MAG TPA: DUF2092 domain-containing protein [Chthonomonadaceae bacterium]|nr:DUF2092 domain-containing protein [Chthonomonadaceae bacterium]
MCMPIQNRPRLRLRHACGPALLLAFWGLVAASAAKADDQAKAILQQVQHTFDTLQTLTADATVTIHDLDRVQTSRMTGTIQLKKPDLFRLEMNGDDNSQIVSDGKTLWFRLGAPPYPLSYKRLAADPDGHDLTGIWTSATTLFLDRKRGRFDYPDFRKPSLENARYAGSYRFGDVDYACVEIVMPLEPKGSETIRYYIGPDKLIHRMTVQARPEGGATDYEAEIRNVKTDVPLPAKTFAFQPPPTAEVYEEDYPYQQMFHKGVAGLDFRLPLAQGGQVHLADVLEHNQDVVLVFWSSSRKESVKALSDVQERYSRLKRPGVAVIAIDHGDSPRTIRAIMARYKITFPMAMGGPWNGKNYGIFRKYNIILYPMAFRINRKGELAGVEAGGADNMVTAQDDTP